MNKKKIIKWMVLPLALLATACTDYQSSIDELSQRVDGIDQRVTALEGLNDDIEAIKEIVDAQKLAGYITAVTETADGYQFTMSNGKVINVHNGRDGRDGTNGTNGQDGHTPVIGVTQDTDGNWYWTVDGEYLLDAAGNKVRANGTDGEQGPQGPQGEQGQQGQQGEQGPQGPQGEQGAQGPQGEQGPQGPQGEQGEKGDKGDPGITPQLRINTTTLEWEVSLDNGTTWQSLHIVAVGAKGDQGEKGDKGDKGDKGEKGDKGDKGDAFFQSVVVGETEVTFTLADGTTTFTLPLMDTFKKVRDRVQSIVFIPENLDGMMTLQNGVQTTVRYRVMPEAVATALATSYASTLSFIGEEVIVSRGIASAGITINSVVNEGNGRLALTVTPTGMTAGQGYAFALVMNDGTSMYSTAYTSVFYAIPPVAIGIAADGILAGKGNVSVGSTVRLIALLVPTDTNMKGVQWTSSDATVATVDANGLVTAHSNGTAIITVTSTADPTVSKSITVIVSDGTITLNTDDLVSQSSAE
ncbi:MAG: Ig-like domain-containing protein [Bacteroidales bacterium]|nr:Ig-like domain-containing protein [Bacteroidales bacterium]